MFGGGIARGLAGAMGRGGGSNTRAGGPFAKLMAAQGGQQGPPTGPPPVPMQGPPPGMMGPPNQGSLPQGPPQGPPQGLPNQGMGPSPEVLQQIMARRQQMMNPGQGPQLMPGQAPQGMMRPSGY